MSEHVVAVTEIHGVAGRRDELRELMRAPHTVVPEPSGPGDPPRRRLAPAHRRGHRRLVGDLGRLKLQVSGY